MQNGINGVTVLRNEPLPTKIPASGLLILRDGDAGEPEITLSPTRYHYVISGTRELGESPSWVNCICNRRERAC